MEMAPAQTLPLVSGNDKEDAEIAKAMHELYGIARRLLPETDELQGDDHMHHLVVLTDTDLKPVLQCAVVLAMKDAHKAGKHKPFIEKIMSIHDEAARQKKNNLGDAMKRLLKQPKKDDLEIQDGQEYSVQKQVQALQLKFRAERFSALHMAAACGNLEMVKLLVGDHDGPDGASDKYGLLFEKTAGGWTALHLCSNQGHEAVVEFLMVAHKSKMGSGDEEKTAKSASDFMMDNRGSTPLHFAVWNCHLACVEQLLNWDDTGYLANQRSMDIFFLTPLHIISMRSADGNEEMKVRTIADSLLIHARRKYGRFECINTRDCCKSTPLHWAVRSDSAELVRLYLDPANSSDNIDVLAEDLEGKTPLHIAVEEHRTRCEDLLMSNKRVWRELERLHTERQVSVESTNAILIGASLIASVTFAAYLQPPLGWVAYYNEKPFSDAPPGEFRHYAAVGKDAALKAFWILDCLAFLVSIATILTSTQNVLRRDGVHLKDDIRRTAKWLQLVSALFQLSVCCILGAFVAAGIADLPDNISARKYTYLPTGVLGSVLLLMFLIAAKKWGWKFTGNGHGKRFLNSLRRRKMKDLKVWMAAGAESLREKVCSKSLELQYADRLQLRDPLVKGLQRIANLDDRMEVMEEVKNVEEKRHSKDPKVNYHRNLSPKTCRQHARSALQEASNYMSGIHRLDELQFAQLEELVREAIQDRLRRTETTSSTDSRVQVEPTNK